jgi:2-polyprenyl-3-methyl-5-hydroxy-6-metoxy-1,4-benzoquinol methylase
MVFASKTSLQCSMRYRVKGHLIRSENTAKPPAQAAREVLLFLERLPRVNRACDFGCGKLRYAKSLARRSGRLTLVDSEIQLARRQVLFGNRTTVAEYAQKHMATASTLTVHEFLRLGQNYDFILCANVLSAIPSTKERSIVLRGILHALGEAGRCLFVTQYRNSYFASAARLHGATAHMDGWILQTGRGSFYYGLLPLQKLKRLVSRHGYAVVDAWIAGQSAFVLAGARRGT